MYAETLIFRFCSPNNLIMLNRYPRRETGRVPRGSDSQPTTNRRRALPMPHGIPRVGARDRDRHCGTDLGSP